MEHVCGLDIVLASVVLVSGLFALFRGLLSEMLGIGSWIVSGVCGIYLLPYVSPLTDKYISNPVLSNLVAGIASSVILLIVLTMICSFVTGLVRKSALNGVDHGLGFLFGCARGVLILVLVYFLIYLLAAQVLDDLKKDSVLFPYLEQICMKTKDHLPDSLFDNPKAEDDDADEKDTKPKKKKSDSEELDAVLRAISKDEIDIAVEDAKELPKDDPLRQMLEKTAKNAPKSFWENLMERLKSSAAPKKKTSKKKKGKKELFDKLNTPEIEAKDTDALYEKKDKEDLNRLILENVEDMGEVLP